MASLFITFTKSSPDIEVDYELKTVIRAAVAATLAREGFAYDAQVSVTLCGAEYIRSLNASYRDKDKATDVLSFPMYENGDFVSDGEAGLDICLGDVVISLERASEQAEELGHSFLREVAFLAIHSTLHLLGYDHERSKEEDEVQCRLQREIIETFDII